MDFVVVYIEFYPLNTSNFIRFGLDRFAGLPMASASEGELPPDVTGGAFSSDGDVSSGRFLGGK
jgi:hypothetical protein